MKKIITVLLALVMALALLPATIWAEGETNTDAVAQAETDGGIKTYATLVEAVRNVKPGGTVTLLKDATGGGVGTYNIASNTDQAIAAKNFTIDFGGFTYTVDRPAVGSKGYETQAFHLEWSGDENNNHSVKLMNGTIEAAKDSENVKLLVQNYCNLILENITLDGTNLLPSNIGYYTLSNCCGTVTVKNSTIIAHGGGVAFDVDGCREKYNNSPVNLSVEGNSVIQGKIEVTEGNTLNIKGGSFTDLATAFKYAADKATIKLAADFDAVDQLEVLPNKDITLDMNGKTITYAGQGVLQNCVVVVHNGAALTVTGNGTIDGGTPKNENDPYAYGAIALTKQGDDSSIPAKLTIENGTMHGHVYGVVGNGMRHNTEITINGGKLEADLGAAIYHPQDGKLTINNGELIGFNTAVEIRSGNLIVHDGSFTATAKPTDVEGNGNGTTTAGAAIAIAQHNTKKPIDVTINGGIFNGEHALYESNPQNNEEEFIKQVTLAVKGGTFNGLIYSKDLTGFVTGGTFTTNPSQYIDTSNQYDITFVNETRLYTVTKSEADKPAEVKVVASTNGEDSGELISAEIPMAAVDENKDLTVADEEGKISVRFNESAVNSIKGEDEGTLNIEIKTGTTASDENKAALEEAMKDKKEGSALVVSLNMTKTIDKELVPVFTEEVEGATAIVTIPYALQDGEKLVVYYLNDGTLKELGEDVVKYEDGFVILTLEHFSEYVLTTVAAPSVDPGENPGENPGDTKPGDTKPGDTKPGEGKSDAPKTFDAGIAVYGVTAILSVTGMAWVGLKKRK